MNSLRPVALTSAVMKICQCMVLCKLEKLVKDYIDPLQFAYKKNRSTDDVVLYSLKNIYSHLEKLVKDYIDPLQFAYRKNRSTDDVVLHSLKITYSHLEKTGSTVRLMFFDFSSAFNTLQPYLLVQKLSNMKLPSSIISWIFDYLTSRLQYVRLNGLVICY